MKRVFAIICGLAIGLSLDVFLLPQLALAGSCGYQTRTVYQAPYVASYVEHAYQPAIATYLPLVLATPVYNVGYAYPQAVQPALSVPAPATASPCSAEVKALTEELKQQREEMRQLKAELLRGVQPPAAAPPLPAIPPIPQTTAAPRAGGGVDSVGSWVGILQGKCAACHTDNVAPKKGKGFVMFVGGKTYPVLTQLSDRQWLKVTAKMRQQQMPPPDNKEGIAPITDAEYEQVALGIDQLAFKDTK